MKEKARIEAVQAVVDGRLSVAEAAYVLSLSERQVYRSLAAARDEGLAGLVHGNSGRTPWNKSDEAMWARVLRLAREHYPGVNDQHLCQLLEREHSIRVHPEALRRNLRAAGLPPKRKRRAVTLDAVELEAKRQEVQAALSETQSRLNILLAGPRPEEVQRALADVAAAEQNLKRFLNGSRPQEVSEAEGHLRIARAAYDQAAKEYERTKALHESGDYPKKRLDAAVAALETARGQLEVASQRRSLLVVGARAEDKAIARENLRKATATYQLLLAGSRPEEIDAARSRVEQAQANLRLIEAQLAEAQIASPIAGTITSIPVKGGEVVRPGQALVNIADARKQWTDVYIEETNIRHVRVEQPVEVVLPAFPGKSFRGRVTSLEETRVGERQTKETMDLRTLRVRVMFEQPDPSLRSGMSAEVRFPVGR